MSKDPILLQNIHCPECDETELTASIGNGCLFITENLKFIPGKGAFCEHVPVEKIADLFGENKNYIEMYCSSCHEDFGAIVTQMGLSEDPLRTLKERCQEVQSWNP